MYRNNFDTDCITWSPQGRIFQIEYAMEGVKQGTCVVGCRSNNFVVLCALKRSLSTLAMSNKKLLKIDDHIGMSWSGITADAKVVANFMRMESLNHKFVNDAPVMVNRLANELADKAQVRTQRASKRPYCVGTLLAGCDLNGPHLIETCPSGNFSEHYAMAIGRRCQAAKTYLEKHFETFPEVDRGALIRHAITALASSVPADQEILSENIAVGIVGVDVEWNELPIEEIEPILSDVERPKRANASSSDTEDPDPAI